MAVAADVGWGWTLAQQGRTDDLRQHLQLDEPGRRAFSVEEMRKWVRVAATNDHWQTVCVLLENAPSARSREKLAARALCVAVMSGAAGTAQEILRLDPGAPLLHDDDYAYLIEVAASRGQDDVIRAFLTSRGPALLAAPISAEGEDGWLDEEDGEPARVGPCALASACAHGHLPAVQQLLAAKADAQLALIKAPHLSAEHAAPLELLLGAGMRVCQEYDGRTLLQRAVNHPSIDLRVVELLLRSKADLQQETLPCAIMFARGPERRRLASLLLQHGAPCDEAADVQVYDRHDQLGCSPLGMASFVGCVPTATLLLSAKAQPCVDDLHGAARMGHVAMLGVLVGAKADVNARASAQSEYPGCPPLFSARSPLVARFLLDSGARVLTTAPVCGSSVLHKLTEMSARLTPLTDLAATVAVLIAAKADPSTTNLANRTPLHCWARYGAAGAQEDDAGQGGDEQGGGDAVETHGLARRGAAHRNDGSVDVAAHLLAAKAGADAQDADGNTALHLCCSFVGSTTDAHVALLLRANARPDRVNFDGRTALGVLVSRDMCGEERVRVAERLLASKASPGGAPTGARDARGTADDPDATLTPLHLCCSLAGADVLGRSGCGLFPLRCVELLLAARADPNRTSAGGRTPLHVLVRRCASGSFGTADACGSATFCVTEVAHRLLGAKASVAAADHASFTPLCYLLFRAVCRRSRRLPRSYCALMARVLASGYTAAEFTGQWSPTKARVHAQVSGTYVSNRSERSRFANIGRAMVASLARTAEQGALPARTAPAGTQCTDADAGASAGADAERDVVAKRARRSPPESS
jgi:ankyrin repeat protein